VALPRVNSHCSAERSNGRDNVRREFDVDVHAEVREGLVDAGQKS
jgi:hypothetical protein